MSLMEAIRRATGGKPRMEDKKPDDMEEDDKDTSAEDDDKDVDAEDEDEDTSAEDDDKDVDAEDEEEETYAEDEDDKKMSAGERAAFARGRAAERKRVAKILGSRGAEANPALAAHLAFNTGDKASKALAALKASAPAATAGNLGSRMAGRTSQTGRGGEAPAGRKDAGASWDKALVKANVAVKGK